VRGGFVLGASGRHTRRANSVAPDPGGGGDLDARLDEVEAWYAGRGQPAVFKLTAAADPPGLDEALAMRGYAREGETLGMTVALEGALSRSPAAMGGRGSIELLAGRVDQRWFEASCVLSGIAAEARDDYRAILDRCVETQRAVIFGSLEREGRLVSVAMGSVVEDVVSFVAVATDREHRGQGLAETVLRAIGFVAREHEAERALLSVERENGSARRLYTRMGFEERYRYWYRVQRGRRGPRGRRSGLR